MSRKILIIIFTLIFAALACNLPQPTELPLPTPLVVTATSPSASLTPTLAASPIPTLPTIVISTAQATNTSIPCNLAAFVSDVTYPDNTQVVVNTAFTKTWRLRNAGSCTWTSGYQLVFDSSELMGGPASQQLTAGSIAPGQTVDVSVDLVAPAAPGTYRGNWRIREPGGTLFALKSGPFWVQIKAVAAAPSLPAWPILSQGDTGAEVFALQYLLRYHGSGIAADGIFGPQTRNAVISFQAAKGLTQDGIVGPNTWTALITGATVSQGSTNEAVRAAQYLLRDKYGYGIAVDGIFGPATNTAVRDFQTNYSLSVDGIVGPQTWQALVGY